jgi:hypothetical protein
VANFFRLIILLAFPAVAVEAQEAQVVTSADEWYQATYAPLYQDRAWEKADEIAGHFAATLHLHDDGQRLVSSREWITENLQEWKIDGWIQSEIDELEYDLLNDSTASFKVRWRDSYSGGNIAYECSWYLADFNDGRWLITGFAIIDCADHGL